jgi:hypothetical protein
MTEDEEDKLQRVDLFLQTKHRSSRKKNSNEQICPWPGPLESLQGYRILLSFYADWHIDGEGMLLPSRDLWTLWTKYQIFSIPSRYFAIWSSIVWWAAAVVCHSDALHRGRQQLKGVCGLLHGGHQTQGQTQFCASDGAKTSLALCFNPLYNSTCLFLTRPDFWLNSGRVARDCTT